MREWTEVVHSGQDCRISPTGHDSMVGTTLTIEREIEGTWNTQDTGVGSKREDQLLLVRERGRILLLHTIFRTRARVEHE